MPRFLKVFSVSVVAVGALMQMAHQLCPRFICRSNIRAGSENTSTSSFESEVGVPSQPQSLPFRLFGFFTTFTLSFASQLVAYSSLQ